MNEKWISVWGNAVSIAENRPESYSKNITLRYPIRCPFAGESVKLTMDNYCGTDDIKISKMTILVNDVIYTVSFSGCSSTTIAAGCSVVSDEIDIAVTLGSELQVSFYLEDYTQMRSAVYVQGPLSGGSYCIGDGTAMESFPIDISRKTNIVYFLTDVSVKTITDASSTICSNNDAPADDSSFSKATDVSGTSITGNVAGCTKVPIVSGSSNTATTPHCILCYGDSITAQDWPDYLALRSSELGINNVSVIRKATSGSRILREYNCITYESYGLKAINRFPHEIPSANGVDTIILQQGINDIIHPVGVEINPFRPMSDLPSIDELIEGFKYYIEEAHKLGLKVYAGTLLPIKGWRTYADFRDVLRNQFNDFLRTTNLLDGCIDFDLAVRNPEDPAAFLPEYDSGDHLHPSAAGYKAMAEAVPVELLR